MRLSTSIPVGETMKGSQGSKMRFLRRASIWLVYLGPFLFTALYVARFGVNVLFGDEWGLPYMFRMIRMGGFGFFSLFWPANNVHRIVVPKLVWAAMDRVGDFDVRLSMFISLAFLLATYLGVIWLAKRHSKPGTARLHVSVLATGILLFSLVHYDTWLWGFQLTFVAAVAFTMAAILVLSCHRLRPVTRLAIAAVFCLLASFTAGHGPLAWLVILPSVYSAFRKSRRIWACLAVVIGFAITCAAYRIDYQPGAQFQPDVPFIVKHPFQVVAFALTLLGAPFCQVPNMCSWHIACLVGGIICAGFVLLVWDSIRRGRLDQTAPYLSIGLFALGCAGLIAVGRVTLCGLAFAATTSRYMICHVWLAIAVIHLMASLDSSPVRRWLFVIVVGEMIFLNVADYGKLLQKGQELRTKRTDAALFLEVEAYIDDRTGVDEGSLLFPLFPWGDALQTIRKPAEMFGEDGFCKIERHATFDERPPFCGCFEVFGDRMNGTTNSAPLYTSGWAVLPQHVIPEIVLISVGEERKFIAGARVGRIERPDVARDFNDSALLPCGWEATVSREYLPLTNAEIKAWVYDRRHSAFLRLTNCASAEQIVLAH